MTISSLRFGAITSTSVFKGNKAKADAFSASIYVAYLVVKQKEHNTLGEIAKLNKLARPAGLALTDLVIKQIHATLGDKAPDLPDELESLANDDGEIAVYADRDKQLADVLKHAYALLLLPAVQAGTFTLQEVHNALNDVSGNAVKLFGKSAFVDKMAAVLQQSSAEMVQQVLDKLNGNP